MSEKSLVAAPEEIADEGKVRLGDAALYFDPAADQRAKAPPAEIADEGTVRLGDAALYFDPAADEAAQSAGTTDTK
jgi:hypothetical protein